MTTPMQSLTYNEVHTTEEDELLTNTFPCDAFAHKVLQQQQQAQEYEDRRTRDHVPILKKVGQTVKSFRGDIGIEPYWTIDTRICCPVDMPEAEASIWWDEHSWYARMMMRCDVPDALVYHLVAHELFELLDWRTGNVFRQLVEHAPDDELTAHLRQMHLLARNQEIEIRVQRFFGGIPRKHHLLGPFEYANPHSVDHPLTRQQPQLAKTHLVTLPIYECPTGEQHVIDIQQQQQHQKEGTYTSL